MFCFSQKLVGCIYNGCQGIECVFYWATVVVGGAEGSVEWFEHSVQDYSFTDILLEVISLALLEATEYF